MPAALRALPLKHLDLQKNPRLSGAAETRASSQSDCSGGAAKYLRGGQPLPQSQPQTTAASFPYRSGSTKGARKIVNIPE